MLLCLGEGPLHWEDNLQGVLLGYYLGTHVGQLGCLVGIHLAAGHNYLVAVVLLDIDLEVPLLRMNMGIDLEVLRVHQLHLLVDRNCIQIVLVDSYLPVGILDTENEIKNMTLTTYNLGIQIRNMKMVFNFYCTWRWVMFEKLMMKIYDFFYSAKLFSHPV